MYIVQCTCTVKVYTLYTVVSKSVHHMYYICTLYRPIQSTVYSYPHNAYLPTIYTYTVYIYSIYVYVYLGPPFRLTSPTKIFVYYKTFLKGGGGGLLKILNPPPPPTSPPPPTMSSGGPYTTTIKTESIMSCEHHIAARPTNPYPHT